MSDTDLSSRIRQRREQLGLSQEELAARMGYRSKSSITKLEKGINDLPRAKLEELAAALDTTPTWLMGLADLPCPPPGFEPLPEMARVPLVGSIACGTPSSTSTARARPSCCWPTTPPSARPWYSQAPSWKKFKSRAVPWASAVAYNKEDSPCLHPKK